jgi:hypothetical protein
VREICYFCSKPATSDEHVPPKCIFPEQKDTSGKDYRLNLITVPSCDIHNIEKSKDDEYLMMVLAAHYKNNGVAKNHVATKIFRSWKRNPSFARTVVKKPQLVQIDGENHIAFEINDEKFNRVLELTANGIYFHTFNAKTLYRYKLVATPFLKAEGTDADFINSTRKKLLVTAELLFNNSPKLGENQEVFWYQLTPEIEGMTTMRMCFYEAFHVVLMASPNI